MKTRGLTVVLLLGLCLTAGVSQEKKPQWPVYNTATVYEVDADWPQVPKGFVWGHVPGITVDRNDHVYVFTRSTPPVQVYGADGKFLRAWGEDSIETAHHIKVDPDGNIWVTDIGNHVVQKHTPEGKLLLRLGTKGEAGRDKSHFNKPTDVAFSPEGDVYVSDGYGNARVVQFDAKGNYVREWGELGPGRGQFNIPHAIAFLNGRVYVADRNNVRIQVFDRDGRFIEEWRDLVVPWGFHVTDKNELWVCGSSPMQWRSTDSALGCPPNDQVFMKFNPEGKLLQLVTLPKGIDGLERPGEVNWVHAIAFDSRGNMYLGDIIGRRAQKFDVKRP